MVLYTVCHHEGTWFRTMTCAKWLSFWCTVRNGLDISIYTEWVEMLSAIFIIHFFFRAFFNVDCFLALYFSSKKTSSSIWRRVHRLSINSYLVFHMSTNCSSASRCSSDFRSHCFKLMHKDELHPCGTVSSSSRFSATAVPYPEFLQTVADSFRDPTLRL